MAHGTTVSDNAEGVTSIDETSSRSQYPTSFSYPRVFSTPDGTSHFEDVTVDLSETNFAPPASPVYIGGNVPASSAFFGGFEPAWGAHDLEAHLCHPAPAAQFIIVLQGEFSVTVMDGETRRFRPGDVFRLEDTPPGKGHISVVGDKPGVFMFVR